MSSYRLLSYTCPQKSGVPADYYSFCQINAALVNKKTLKKYV